MAKQRVTESKAAKQSRQAAERERRSRWFLQKKNFLDSQGPLVVELELISPDRYSDTIDQVLLMRRVDLEALARSEQWPQPITSSVRKFMRNGGRPSDDMLADGEIDNTMAMCAAITRACIIVPPPAFVAAEIDAADITADMCKPLFVEEDPDEDQVILLAPGAGFEARPSSVDSGYLHPSDLMRIAARAYAMGPGAAGWSFRQSRETVEAVPEVEAPADVAA